MDVIEIMHTALVDTLTDERGCVDFTRAAGMSNTSMAKEFVAELTRRAEKRRSGMYTVAELDQVGRATSQFRDTVHALLLSAPLCSSLLLFIGSPVRFVAYVPTFNTAAMLLSQCRHATGTLPPRCRYANVTRPSSAVSSRVGRMVPGCFLPP